MRGRKKRGTTLMTLDEVARVMGISRRQARWAEQTALAKLREAILSSDDPHIRDLLDDIGIDRGAVHYD